MSGYLQGCAHVPCPWRKWIENDDLHDGLQLMITHIEETHVNRRPQLSLVPPDNRIKLTSDQMEIIIAGIQTQIAEATVYELMGEDEPLIPLLTDLTRIAKEGGTIDVVPF